MLYREIVGPLLPLRYHIVGIGGIGMSGLAILMHKRGYAVSGSELRDSDNVRMIRNEGIGVIIGHSVENIANADCIVRSTAVPDDNIEIGAAKASNKLVIGRAELLAGLMSGGFKTICISGSHGKTTTTAMVGSIMLAAEMDPTILCGGIIRGHDTNIIYGSGPWMVIEADESDGTCATLNPNVSIVTNIQDEHGHNLGGYEGVKNTFKNFLHNTKDFCALCADDAYCSAVAREADWTYGTGANANIIAKNIEYADQKMRFDIIGGGLNIQDCYINMAGEHNVLNALGAAVACSKIGISQEAIIKGLANFQGTKRRFEKIAETGGLTLYDDYAHHPNEIKATLKAARQVAGTCKIILVFQPHRFSRLSACLNQFNDALEEADFIGIMDVYSAGENAQDFNNIGIMDLLATLNDRAMFTKDTQSITNFIIQNASSGDIILFMGAGSVTDVAREALHGIESTYAK